MREKAYIKITSALLALLVLSSTFSFSIHKHYCGHFLKDVSYIVPSKGCGMEKVSNPLKETCKESLSSIHCCKDLTTMVKGQETIIVAKGSFSQYLNVALVPTISRFFDFGSPDRHKIVKVPYTPPPCLSEDIYLINQSFLI